MEHPSDSAPPSPPRRSRWRRVLLYLGSGVLVLIASVVAVYLYVNFLADRELKQAIAEVDRVDPYWRLADIEEHRQAVSDEKNAALVVMAVTQQMPASWPTPRPNAPVGQPLLDDEILGLLPPIRLNEQQISELRSELAKVGPALSKARQLAEMPEGRFPITWTPDWFTTKINCPEARTCARLLRLDAVLRAQDEDPDGALASTRGVLNCARAIGDEPMTISQLVRIAIRSVAVASLERDLAQGEPGGEGLRALQTLLLDEDQADTFRIALRGERAGQFQLMGALSRGEISMSQLGGATGKPTVMDTISDLAGASMARQSTAWLLRQMTEMIEALDLPREEQTARLDQVEARVADAPVLARLIFPALLKIREATLRSQAQLRCARVGLALERCRRATGTWPERLEQLVPNYLAEVPTDPYDGQPLRYRRSPDGVLVYSVGLDQKDDGGKLDRKNPIAPGTDLGFQLWNLGQRRQPPLPPRRVMPPPGGGLDGVPRDDG